MLKYIRPIYYTGMHTSADIASQGINSFRVRACLRSKYFKALGRFRRGGGGGGGGGGVGAPRGVEAAAGRICSSWSIGRCTQQTAEEEATMHHLNVFIIIAWSHNMFWREGVRRLGSGDRKKGGSHPC